MFSSTWMALYLPQSRCLKIVVRRYRKEWDGQGMQKRLGNGLLRLRLRITICRALFWSLVTKCLHCCKRDYIKRRSSQRTFHCVICFCEMENGEAIARGCSISAAFAPPENSYCRCFELPCEKHQSEAHLSIRCISHLLSTFCLNYRVLGFGMKGVER